MQKQPSTAIVAGPCPSTTNAIGNRADVEGIVARIIAAKARRLVLSRKFRLDDYEDIVQELTLEWLSFRPSFAPNRSCLSTYATRIIDTRISEMIRERNAVKRGMGKCPLSLDEPVKDPAGHWASRGELLSDDRRRALPGCADLLAQANLRLDVEATVETLPFPLRSLCALLRTMTITAASQLTGVPRSTIYGAAKEVRRRFAAAGLAEYLPTLSGHFAQNS